MTNKDAIKIFERRLEFAKKEYSDVASDYIEAIKLAISALRAQDKEPCEYCKGTHYTERKALLDNREFELLIDTDNTICVFCKESKDLDEVKIKYCPMCARPLKGEQND